MNKILIIDDEPQIRRFLHIGLSTQGYTVLEADSGAEGISSARQHTPQLIILDLGLPDMDGKEVLIKLREFYTAPIIVLSVRNHESEKVRALDSGANDYVIKPFGIEELLARMRSSLKHYGKLVRANDIYQDEQVYINLSERKLIVNNNTLKLSRKEFDLLKMLMQHTGHIVTQQQLLKEIWGKTHVDDTHYLRIFIARLRTKLGDNPTSPRYIETEPGVGYRFLPGGDE